MPVKAAVTPCAKAERLWTSPARRFPWLLRRRGAPPRCLRPGPHGSHDQDQSRRRSIVSSGPARIDASSLARAGVRSAGAGGEVMQGADDGVAAEFLDLLTQFPDLRRALVVRSGEFRADTAETLRHPRREPTTQMPGAPSAESLAALIRPRVSAHGQTHRLPGRRASNRTARSWSVQYSRVGNPMYLAYTSGLYEGTDNGYSCRSERVRRQGLEPRTRGLRVRSSGNLEMTVDVTRCRQNRRQARPVIDTSPAYVISSHQAAVPTLTCSITTYPSFSRLTLSIRCLTHPDGMAKRARARRLAAP